MVLYKKVFPLGKGLSFFEYITALRKAYFPNYVITIDNIPSTENYRAQIFYTAPLRPLGLYGSYLERILLKENLMPYLASDSRYNSMPYNRTGNSELKLPQISLRWWYNFGNIQSKG